MKQYIGFYVFKNPNLKEEYEEIRKKIWVELKIDEEVEDETEHFGIWDYYPFWFNIDKKSGFGKISAVIAIHRAFKKNYDEMAEICVEMMFNIYKKYLPNEIVFIESEMILMAYEDAQLLYFEDGDWYYPKIEQTFSHVFACLRNYNKSFKDPYIYSV